MNRISSTKTFRRVGAAAVVGALVIAGAGIAGASTNANARAVATSTLSARSANHDHGANKVHPIDGVIKSLSGTSMMVTTSKFGNVTVMFASTTRITQGKTNMLATDLAVNERVIVTPVQGSTMKSFTAKTVRVIPTKVRPIEGVIKNVFGTYMVVTTHRNVLVTVTYLSGTSSTVVTMDHVKLQLSNLVVGERVHVTAAPASTTSNFVAASVTIQSTKVRPIDGSITTLYAVNSTTPPTSMIVTTSKGNQTIDLGTETVVVNGGIVSSLTSTSLSLGQHVHVILEPVAPSTSTPTALLVRVQNQS